MDFELIQCGFIIYIHPQVLGIDADRKGTGKIVVALFHLIHQNFVPPPWFNVCQGGTGGAQDNLCWKMNRRRKALIT